MTIVLLRNYPKIGYVSVELIASMSSRGEVSESFMEKSSEFSPCFGFVPKHLHLLLMHHWLLHCMVMHNSLYKLSWKWLSSITKMGEIERTCGAPMFGFGNWWQSLWTNGCLELYLKVLSIGFSWSTCVGFKESLCRPRCYSRNYLKIGLVRGWSRLSQRVNQVDQHTKHRRCTERDQAIPWYGKHGQLRFVY